MDGSTLTNVSKVSEAERQKAVYQAAINSIELEERRRLAAGYAVMALAHAFGEATREGRFLARVVHFARLSCITFAFTVPLYLFWSIAMNS